ncbi:unnamed protein product, partial [Schistosoma turkestanicum]
SIFMSTALGVSSTKLCILLTFGVFGISLTIFTCALLIGAAIKTSLLDRSTAILISVALILIVIVAVAISLSVLEYNV